MKFNEKNEYVNVLFSIQFVAACFTALICALSDGTLIVSEKFTETVPRYSQFGSLFDVQWNTRQTALECLVPVAPLSRGSRSFGLPSSVEGHGTL